MREHWYFSEYQQCAWCLKIKIVRKRRHGEKPAQYLDARHTFIGVLCDECKVRGITQDDVERRDYPR